MFRQRPWDLLQPVVRISALVIKRAPFKALYAPFLAHADLLTVANFSLLVDFGKTDKVSCPSFSKLPAHIHCIFKDYSLEQNFQH